MERINAKDVQSMMEAYASVYKSEEQEVISEETQELEENRNQRGAAARANRQAAAADAAKRREEGLTVQGRPIRGQGNRELRPHSQRTNQQVSRLLPRKPGTAPTSSTSDTPVQKPRPQSPSSNLKPGNPNVVVSPKSGEETKFERRLPTSAELRAAQAARKAATAGGASKKEAEYQAVKAGVGVSKGTVKDPKIAADAARKAELERIRSRAATQTKAGVRPTVASTADPKTPPPVNAGKSTGGKEDIFTSTPPGGKAYGNAAKSKTSVPTGGAVKTGNVNLPAAKSKTSVPTSSISGKIEKVADTYVKPNVERIGAQIGRDRASKMPGGNIPILGDVIKNRGERIGRDKAGKLYNKTKTQVKSGDVGGLLKTASEVGRELTQSADLFDIVKGHLMSEGLTEEEALKQMLQLTDEQRTEIIEGSCGSKKKKKSKKGGY